MNLKVIGGAGVPAAGVSGVVLNVTVVNSTTGGYLTLFPAGVSRPGVSTINCPISTAITNGALVPVGANGQISIYNLAGTVDVIVDIEGWLGEVNGTAGGQVVVGNAVRILDSRTSNGGRNGVPLAANETMRLPVLGTHGLPSTGVAAITANITLVPAQTGYVTVFPSGSSRPLASTVNATSANQAVANLVVVPVGADGGVNIFSSVGGMHALLDVTGWITAGTPTAGHSTRAVTSVRILDTRGSLGGHSGPLGSGETITLPVLGVGGLPATGVAGVIVHVTAIASTQGGYFVVYGSGTRRPVPSTVDFGVGTIVSNTAVVPVGPNGAISVYNLAGTAHACVDIQGWIAATELAVTPPLGSALNGPALTAPDSVRAAQILTNTTRYAMTTWWNSVAPGLLTTPLTADAQSDGQDTVRRLAMTAFGLSAALASGSYDATATGVSADVATSRTVQLLDRVAATHVASAPGGWGASWQSTLWSNYAGRAAWLLWPRLGGDTQARVARMIEYEADFGAGESIHYLRNAAGTVLTPGDTGSDDSWTGMPLQLALVMFPDHPHAAVWRAAMVRIALASWARPADVSSATVVNGAAIGDWIDGSNVEANGVVINHTRVAPDYSTLIYQNVDAVIAYSLAGRPTPRATIALLAPVYAAYRSVSYAAPPYNSPGGTVYVTNSATVYYPQGNDWGTGQMLPYALVDAETAAHGIGGTDAATYETLHANATLTMQNRFTDRHTYANSTEYNYVGREEHTCQLAAQLYLTKLVRDRGLATFTNDSYWLG